MITEQDLRAAIAECEGARNPNANTCIKLAAYYTILNNLLGEESPQDTQDEPHVRVRMPAYSGESRPQIAYSDSEFSRIVQDKGIEKCYPVIDELMSTLEILNPRLYASVISKLSDNIF